MGGTSGAFLIRNGAEEGVVMAAVFGHRSYLSFALKYQGAIGVTSW